MLSFNLVIAHIPGKANYAADFFYRVEADRTSTVSLKLNEKITVRDIETNTEAKIPNTDLNSIECVDEFFESKTENEAFINQLKRCGLYETYQLKMSNIENEIKGLVKLYKPQVNMLEYINPADSLNGILV